MVSGSLIFLLFFLPLLVIPTISLGFEPPKVLISEAIITFILILQILQKGRLSFKSIHKIQLGLCLALLFLCLFHLFFTFDITNLFGNIFRLQGIALLIFLLIFSLISSHYHLPSKFKFVYLTSLILLFLTTLIFGDNSAGRAIGSLGEPNALAAVTVFIIPFILYSFKKFWINILVVFLGLFIIFQTQSASAFIAFLIMSLFIILTKLFKLTLLKSVVICVFLIITTFALPFLKLDLLDNLKPQSRFENRGLIWQTALISGFESPILGSGFGSVQIKLQNTSQELNNTLQYVAVDSSHHFLLDYWIEGGILGLILIVEILTFSFLGLISLKSHKEVMSLLGVVAVMCFNPVSVVTLISFWWLLGQGFTNHQLLEES